MIGGADTVEECEDQIHQVLSVLEAGGFSTKFVITSGQPNIDESIKVLGYKWAVKTDSIAPGFNEINFNPNFPPNFPRKTIEELICEKNNEKAKIN